MLVASSPKDSATARAAFIRSQQQHLSVTAVASVKKPAQRDKQVRGSSFLVIKCPTLIVLLNGVLGIWLSSNIFPNTRVHTERGYQSVARMCCYSLS